MCYRKPGPRCSPHARVSYLRARADFQKDGSEKKEARMKKAFKTYMATPEGIALIKKSAENETDPEKKNQLLAQAEKANQSMMDSIQRYKVSKGNSSTESKVEEPHMEPHLPYGTLSNMEEAFNKDEGERKAREEEESQEEYQRRSDEKRADAETVVKALRHKRQNRIIRDDVKDNDTIRTYERKYNMEAGELS